MHSPLFVIFSFGNLGNTCFQNGVLQALKRANEFVTSLSNIRRPRRPFSEAVGALFLADTRHEVEARLVHLRDLFTAHFGQGFQRAGRMQDAEEWLFAMVNHSHRNSSLNFSQIMICYCMIQILISPFCELIGFTSFGFYWVFFIL